MRHTYRATCGCDPCQRREAYRTDRYRRYVRPVMGITPWVDSAPALAALDRMSRVASAAEIERHLGVPTQTVAPLLRRRPPKVRATRAAVILAGESTLRPARIGTARRIQALHALGWSLRRLHAESGIQPTTLRRALDARPCPNLDIHERVAALYERLHTQRPTARTLGDRRGISRVVSLAATRGWAPPAAWDDIDDPDETPRGLRAVAEPTTAELLDEYEHLIAGGETPERAAGRVGRSLGGLRSMALREGRRALYTAVSAAYDRQRGVAA
jgi:lambda repressor-like predicted transcriptional regulator